MAATPLTTTTSGSGAQSATQSPQTAGSANSGTATASGVQPGTAQDVLRSNDGVQLSNPPLNTINLGSVSTSTSNPPAPVQPHHINPVLASFSIGLFILAVVLFWLTSRSVKSTT